MRFSMELIAILTSWKILAKMKTAQPQEDLESNWNERSMKRILELAPLKLINWLPWGYLLEINDIFKLNELLKQVCDFRRHFAKWRTVNIKFIRIEIVKLL